MSFNDSTGRPSGTDESPAQAARDEASGLAHSAAESTKGVAGEVKEQAGGVAAEAGQQAKKLLGEAKSQLAMDLLGQARTEATGQVSEQQRKLAGGVRTFSDDLRSMADGVEGGVAADAARQIAERAGTAASWLDEREPAELLDELKRFARRRPGVFIAGAALAGVLAGRLTRGIKDEASDDDQAARPVGAGTGAHRAPGAPSTPAGTEPYGTPGTVPPVQPSGGPVGGPTPITHTPAGTPSTSTGTAAGAPRSGVEGEGLR